MHAKAFKTIDKRSLPTTRELLLEGGDARILSVAGTNEYGCRPYPDEGLLSFASSTASTISPSGFAAADALRERVATEPKEAVCDREFNRIRDEFSFLCDVSDLSNLAILFTASGTDAHLIASRLVDPDHIVMVERSETGKGVPAALAGRHFSTRSAYRKRLTPGTALSENTVSSVSEVHIRNADGSPRDCFEIDKDISAQVETLVKDGHRILLVLVDVSKTGMIAPGISCALELKQSFPDAIEVLVDACQFRMASSTLRAYLEKGSMVALTGSKFITGPAFSGALLIPETVRKLKSPKVLSAYSSKLEWPDRMRSRCSGTGTNFGLLLRWEAALTELRAFRAIPEVEVVNFLKRFARAISLRLQTDPGLEPLTVPPLDRLALTAVPSWDHIQTIFPFRLLKNGKCLGQNETSRIHTLLQEDLSSISNNRVAALRCSLGQPVTCGAEGSVLRLCASARSVVEGQKNPDAIINQALSVLDKAGLLISLMEFLPG